ncbi:MAG TPA: hypothetical protein VGL13_02725, partial [Polyangiaceae bacterium]
MAPAAGALAAVILTGAAVATALTDEASDVALDGAALDDVPLDDVPQAQPFFAGPPLLAQVAAAGARVSGAGARASMGNAEARASEGGAAMEMATWSSAGIVPTVPSQGIGATCGSVSGLCTSDLLSAQVFPQHRAEAAFLAHLQVRDVVA